MELASSLLLHLWAVGDGTSVAHMAFSAFPCAFDCYAGALGANQEAGAPEVPRPQAEVQKEGEREKKE